MSEEIKVSDEAREVARREIKDYLGECLIPRGTANPQFHAAGRHIQLLLNQQIQLACLNWRHRDAALQTKIAALEAALDGILTRYLNLALSGDCGSWNPEKEAEVIAARLALNSTKGEK